MIFALILFILTYALMLVFHLNILLQQMVRTRTLTPMIFVLGVRPGENRYILNELGVGYRMCEETTDEK